MPKYLGMLEAGGSEPPAQLVQRANIDITSPDFWLGGLDLVDEMVQEAKRLAQT